MPSEATYEVKRLYFVSTNDISEDPNQPRKYFDEEALQDLADSIEAKGIIQPLIVKQDDGNIVLVAGERRLKAARMINLSSVPVIFVEGDTEEISLIENVQRENLNPIEEAEALEAIKTKKNYSDEELAKIIGKARTTVNEVLRLNHLIPEIKDECRHSCNWSRRILLEIARENDPKEQRKLFKKAKDKHLSSEEMRFITRDKKGNRPKIEIILDLYSKLKDRLTDKAIDDLNDDEKAQIGEKLAELQTTWEERMRGVGTPTEK